MFKKAKSEQHLRLSAPRGHRNIELGTKKMNGRITHFRCILGKYLRCMILIA